MSIFKFWFFRENIFICIYAMMDIGISNIKFKYSFGLMEVNEVTQSIDNLSDV